MTNYTCDIHGASRHICAECAHNDLATAEEEIERLCEQVDRITEMLDEAQHELGARDRALAQLAASERRLEEARKAWRVFRASALIEFRPWMIYIARLDRALAEPGEPKP